jgi:hypothetical protein
MDDIDFSSIDFNIKVILPSGSLLNINPVAQLYINEDRVREEIKLLPAQFALFGSIYVQYKRNRDILELKFNELKNKHSKEVREQSSRLKKELNNKQVDEIVNDLEEVKKLALTLIEMEFYVKQLYYLLEGLEIKQNSLKALDYMNAREERAGDNVNKFKLFNNDAINNPIDPNKYEKTKTIGGSNELQ